MRRRLGLSLAALSLVLSVPLFLGPGLLPWPWEGDRGLSLALPWALGLSAGALGLLSLRDLPFVERGLELLRSASARPVPWLGALALGGGGAMALAGIRRHDALQSSAFDLGIFDQVVWEASRGHGLWSSLKGGISILGDHFEPILWPLGALFWIWDSPKALLTFQALALASAAVPTFLLARRRLGAGALAWLFPVALLAFLPLRSLALADFHPESIAVPALLWALFAFETERPLGFALGLAVACLCKESGFVAAAGLGLWALAGRRRALGGAALATGALGLVVAVGLVVPHFRGGPNIYVGERYGYLTGGSLTGLLLAPLRHPWLCLKGLFWPPRKLEYLARLFAPWAFLPLVRPRWLLALGPLLAMNLLADYPLMQSIHTQYNAELIPLLAAASIDGAAWLEGLRPSWSRRVGLALAACTCVLWGSGEPFETLGAPLPSRARRLEAVLRTIPPAASVAAQNDLVPHLSHRDRISLIPTIDGATYVAFDLDAPLPRWNLTPERNRSLLTALLATGYRQIGGEDGFVLLRREDH